MPQSINKIFELSRSRAKEQPTFRNGTSISKSVQKFLSQQ